MPEVKRRDLLAGVAALTGFATVGLLPGTAAAATRRRPGALLAPSLTAGDKAVVARVDARRALRHLKVLSDEIGWRIAGTPSEHRAARYIAGCLRDLGYTVELQPFPVADKYLAEIRSRGERVWQCSASPQGAVASVDGTVVDVGRVTEVTGDVRGRLVLFDRITGMETEQAKAAANAGGRGGARRQRALRDLSRAQARLLRPDAERDRRDPGAGPGRVPRRADPRGRPATVVRGHPPLGADLVQRSGRA
ncbi:hypothetical protein BJY14_004824 [Actinomadura luteofluorescens]|uniref:Uncharacterized protein n=1 Tax=Actinomadura luteofluorescens TaxID=46163 RepID=A0A7Y9EJS8_9ACTN|nr:hypothetical protein [Actinomadura luteofluorescens]NYD48841.1 hypothetical protein [Actinomadura luteofluorescens]